MILRLVSISHTYARVYTLQLHTTYQIFHLYCKQIENILFYKRTVCVPVEDFVIFSRLVEVVFPIEFSFESDGPR